MRVTSHPNASAAELDRIRDGLTQANAVAVGRDATRVAVVQLAHDDVGVLIGGLIGFRRWDWLYIDHLWVAAAHRHAGIGSQLLRAAEAEAIVHGCTHALLDTFSFQARGFYERLGYRVFATLDDCPAGHQAHYMTKALRPADASGP